MDLMRKSYARRFMIAAAAVAALGLLFWSGCSKDLMSPDEQAPRGSSITNPVHNSSLNEPVINVRGRAEVGATVDIFVNDVKMGTSQSLISIDMGDGNTSSLGAFTVDQVDLGEEGIKTIRARITDLYGNVSGPEQTPVVSVTLDQTAPPIEFTGVSGTVDPEWVEEAGPWGPGYWHTGLPRITVSGRTDTTAAGARLRYGINEYTPTEFVAAPSGSIDFDISASSPPLSGGAADTVIVYYLESYDDAGNVASTPVVIRWEVQGREEELFHDDGVYDSYDHVIQGFAGQRVGVRFQAPTWANYVVTISYYIANDQIDDPNNPQAPTTDDFTAWVWRVNSADSLPGAPGNEGYLQPAGYPEDEWVDVHLPNAVEITNNAHFPDKKFYAGMEWENRLNPYIYEDHSQPIAYKSFRFNWSEWELRDEADTMIRATVSDVPGGAGGRQAVLLPEIVDRR
jgi:hypothetical protein